MGNLTLEMKKMVDLMLCLCVIMLFYSFSVKAEKNETAIDRIDIQRMMYPQEKIHMVTDRDLYIGGDTIWLRVFVVDAATHEQTAMSKYAYVELLNPFGGVQKRVKIIEKDGIFAGYIPVDEDIYEGNYTLAAYTMYSENQGKDYLFRKAIRLLAPQSSKFVIDSEFTHVAPGEVKGSFKVRSLNGEKLNFNIMSWTMPDEKFLELPDASKGFSRKFKCNKGEDVVLVRFGDYRKYIPVEYPVEKTDISFYPEGGWLIADEPCTVAFKATDENGKGVMASGIIRDETGEKVAEFSTVHNGMGSFIFVPEKGRTYTAEYMGPDAQLRISELGSSKAGVASLRYRSVGKKAAISIAGGDGHDLELVVALRGRGIIAVPISSEAPLSFDVKDMAPGLYQALLVSQQDTTVLSERLFFIGASKMYENAPVLMKDSTEITLQAKDGFSGGDCSVRIVNGSILPVATENDIRIQLLLQGELRGRIENPGYYFSSNDREAERNLDLLMMVNGWSRYNLPDAILGKYEEPGIPVEIGEEISGQVRSRWKGKPLAGVMIYAIAPRYNFGTLAETDADGNFCINGFDFPEGTGFIFRAMNEKGGNEGNYEFHRDTFPSILPIMDSPQSVAAINPSVFFNDLRWIMLDEVKVQAFNHSDKDFSILNPHALYTRKSDDFASRGITSLAQAVRSIPGISIENDHLMYRKAYVAFYIDGTIYETAGGGSLHVPNVTPPGKLPGTFARSRFANKPSLANVNPYNTRMLLTGTAPNPIKEKMNIPTFSEMNMAVQFQDIERVDFLSSENFFIDRSYGGGVLMITTKSGNNLPGGVQFELKDYLPLGYQQYKEYASPLLSIDADEYDFQTVRTLLWLPSVKFDESGKTIDLKHPILSDYRVIIEGVSDNGDIIYETL